jgi:hypothetical protein
MNVRHQPEIEHEQMHRDQGDREIVLSGHLDQHRRHQRRHHHIVCGRRHADAENKANQRRHHQH